MEADSNRIVQVFFWKQGAAPDLDYVRQVLSIVNPEAFAALAGDNPPLQLFSVIGPWPDDPWTRALQDMRAIPSVSRIAWTDPNQYELNGWQGSDLRTGDHIFIVVAYDRRPALTAEVLQGANTQPPPYAQTAGLPPNALYGQPLAYPWVTPAQAPVAQPSPVPPTQTSPSMYDTGVLPAINIATLPSQQALPPLQDDFSVYYVGFVDRLVAFFIDFVTIALVVAITLSVGFFWATQQTQPEDVGGLLGLYGPFLCFGLLIFMAYFLISWSAYGRTPGMLLMNMRVVSVDGGVPGFGRATLRLVGYFFSALMAGFGFWMIAWDPRHQGFHDRMAETYVVPEHDAVPVPPGIPGHRPSLAAYASMLPSAPAALQSLPAPTTTAQQPYPPGRVVAPTPVTGMAAISSPQPSVVVRVSPGNGNHLPSSLTTTRPVSEQDVTPDPAVPQQTNGDGPRAHADRLVTRPPADTFVAPALPSGPLGPATDALRTQALRESGDRYTNIEKARYLFKSGIEELEKGARPGHTTSDVAPGAAGAAAERFHAALQLVPTAVAYRYMYAVALRYAEGFEVAIGEFRQVLELDPGHYEARQQVALGPRWHDAYAYPSWSDPTPVPTGEVLPAPVLSLLSQPRRAGTRLVLLREGPSKMVVALSRTRRDTWSRLPSPDMPARIELVLQRTPGGPIIAFYVVVRDDPDNPYKGETFLNPHDSGQPSDDATLLGQNMLAQLARQDHTYLIFVDEDDRLLMSRRLIFDAATQVNVARVLYDVQTLPPMTMDLQRFQEAAQWHMDHFSLDQIM